MKNEKPLLPEGWEWKKLGEFCKIEYGHGLPKRNRVEDGKIPVYGSGGIVGHHDKAITKGRTIILGRKGSINLAHLSDGPCWPIDTTFYIEDEFTKADITFLHYFLTYFNLEELSQSSAIPSLRRDDLYTIEIPLPPLPVQKQIVEKLDTLMGGIDRTKKLHEQSADLTSILMQAAIQHEFARAEEEGWERVKMDEISTSKYGYTSKSIKDSSGVPYIRITDIDMEGRLIKENQVYVKIDRTNFEKYKLIPGDILIARSGATVGKSYMFDEEEEYVYASYLIRFRFDKHAVYPAFIKYFLGSRYYWDYINQTIHTSAQPNINAKEIGLLEIPLPPLPVQKQIVARLDAFREMVESLKQQQKERSRWLEKLPEALLEKAFRGEL